MRVHHVSPGPTGPGRAREGCTLEQQQTYPLWRHTEEGMGAVRLTLEGAAFGGSSLVMFI